MSLWSKSKSSSNISRERALSDPEAHHKEQPIPAATHHTFQVTSKDSVPTKPKPEPAGTQHSPNLAHHNITDHHNPAQLHA